MNKIILIGHLGRDPEMSYTPNGLAVTRFSLAVNRVNKAPSGERQEETEWFSITYFGKLAEVSNQYLKKGQKAYVEGRLSTRKYTDRNGIERTSLDVVGTELEILTPKGQASSAPGNYLNDADDGGLGDLDDHPF
jgi:single-strand DNA-binding protein